MEIIEQALSRGQKSLSEYEAKLLLGSYGIPVVKEMLVHDLDGALEAAREIGYPVVLKVCSPEVTHKTEKGLMELNVQDEESLHKAFRQLEKKAQMKSGGFLVQEMVKGSRELVMGMVRDPQFGPCVMFGLGGIFTEILQDVTFRIAPIKRRDAYDMFHEIKTHKLLGPIRGMESVDLESLSSSLIALGKIGLDRDAIQEIDVNPLIVKGKYPVAVDALVILKSTSAKE